MNLSAMILACALLGLLGYLYCLFPPNKIPALLSTIFALTMIMARGYYWTVFERGEGFYTLNRMSALAVFVFFWIAGSILGYIRARNAQRLAHAIAIGIVQPRGR